MPFFPDKPAPKPIDPNTIENKPPEIKQKPDIPEVDKTEEAKPKEETSPQEKAAEKPLDSEEAQESRVLNRNQDSANQAIKKEEQGSKYESSKKFPMAEKPAQDFGHKVNLNPEVAKLVRQAAEQARDAAIRQGEVRELPKNVKLAMERFPNMPPQEVYRNVLARHFTGAMRNSSLYQKLEQKLTQEQVAKQMTSNRDVSEPLKKGELLQLFRMRHQEEKQDIRNILRYELAKAKKMAKERVQAIRYQSDSRGESKSGRLSRLESIKADYSKQQLAQKLSQASSESKFEQILQRVLTGGKNVPGLPEGTVARYLAKSDWEAFIKKVCELNSAEIETKGEFAKLIEAIFRGLFQKASTGEMVLVSDLSFTEEGEVAENKFSQLKIDNKELLKMLESLKPGDPIHQEILTLLGEKFEFIKLMNILQIVNLTAAQKEELLKQLKNQTSDGHKKLEAALLQMRQDNEKGKQPFVYAGYQHDIKERYIGKPKFFMYMIYGISAITIIMILYMIFRYV